MGGAATIEAILKCERETRDQPDSAEVLTLTSSSGRWPKGTGVRPKCVERCPDGWRIYRLTRAQVVKLTNLIGATTTTVALAPSEIEMDKGPDQ